MRIGIFSYGPSDSATILRDSLREAGLTSARRLLSDGNSQFRGRPEDIVINYGSSNVENVINCVNDGTVVNHPNYVRNASNKARALAMLHSRGVRVPNFTADRDQAQLWVDNGGVVFSRQTINGHSGEGIHVASRNRPEHLGNVDGGNSVVSAPLYTQGVIGDRSEYRVHVAFGEIILVQQKRRRNGWRDNPDFSDIVRNHDNGWIYATSNINLSAFVTSDCLLSMEVLGLDFGAVDIIVQNNHHYILEVNTAPGLQGESSRAAYTTAFVNYLNRSRSEEGQDLQEAFDASNISISSSPWGGWGESPFVSSSTEPAPESASTASSVSVPSNATLDAALSDLLEAQQRLAESHDNSEGGVRLRTPTFRRASVEPEQPPARRANPLSSETPPAELVNATSITGPGHYVVELSEGVRTVALKMESGELYSAEHDLFLQEADVAIISQVNI